MIPAKTTLTHWYYIMHKKLDRCKDCMSFVSHKNKKSLTAEQKRYDYWCCAKGKKAIDSIALCIAHDMKRIKNV